MELRQYIKRPIFLSILKEMLPFNNIILCGFRYFPKLIMQGEDIATVFSTYAVLPKRKIRVVP